MGHRALIAYRRPDHLYDLRYSHWGGDHLEIREYLNAENPLANGRIDAEVLADSVALASVLTDFLDPCCYEVLYLVDADFDIRSYHVCWLDFGDGRHLGRGALIGVDDATEDHTIRTWFRAIKTTVSDLVEMGVFSREAARSYLETRITEEQDGYFYTYGACDERVFGGTSTSTGTSPFDCLDSDDEA